MKSKKILFLFLISITCAILITFNSAEAQVYEDMNQKYYNSSLKEYKFDMPIPNVFEEYKIDTSIPNIFNTIEIEVLN